jgi:hypothetical protein
VALIVVFTAIGGGLALAGAATWKGKTPGEADNGAQVVSIGAPVPRGVQNRVSATPPPTAARSPAATPRPGGGQAAATPSPTARAAAPTSPSPSGFPVVLDLIVCDATVDCGEDPARREWDAILACLRVRPGPDNRPLFLAITVGQTSPGGPEGSSVIARSGAIRPSDALTCHPVRAVGRALARGEYTMWLFDGTVALRQARFRLGR